MIYLFMLFGILLIVLVWKRLFNLSGKIFLGISLLIFGFSSLISFFLGLTIILLFAGYTLYYSRYSKMINPRYVQAEATFETNEILRGLTPVEAAYFLELPQAEIFTVAILGLLDNEFLAIRDFHSNLQISLNKNFQITPTTLSPENKRKARNDAAKNNNKILQTYDDHILEMIPDRNWIAPSKVDLSLWYRVFRQSMKKFEGVYQMERTKEYASEIISKYTLENSVFSKGKTSISGWYAVDYFNENTDKANFHRPDWIAPGDDFRSVLLSLRESLQTQTT